MIAYRVPPYILCSERWYFAVSILLPHLGGAFEEAVTKVFPELLVGLLAVLVAV